MAEKTENQSDTSPWVDLSAYGMSLKMAKYKGGLQVLIVEGGDRHPNILTEIGFRKAGDEWYFPGRLWIGKFKEKAPDAILTRVPASNILVDRTNEVFSSEHNGRVGIAMMQVDKESGRTLKSDAYIQAVKERIIASGGHAEDWEKHNRKTYEETALHTAQNASKLTVWFARFELAGHEVQAFGSNPEQAMLALATVWKTYAEREGVDPALLTTHRESVSVHAATTGQGYAKGTSDSLWHQTVIYGDETRFDAFFPNISPAFNSPKP